MPAGWIFFKDDAGEDALELDAILSEDAPGEAEATKFPVESGSTVTDHVLASPRALRLDAVVSNTPILEPEGRPVMQYLDSPSPPRFRVEGAPAAVDRVLWAESTLERIRALGLLVRVVTEYHDCEDMVLVSVSCPRDARTGDALRCVLSFQQVVTVNTLTVALPGAQRKTLPGAQKKRGRQPTSKASEPIAEKAKRRSLAKQLVEAFRGS